MNWRSIRIGDFLHRVRIPVDIEDDQEYNLVTIRMHHKGVVLRGTKHGKDIGTKRMYRVAPGHFILSGIDARHGAFGIVPEELNGAVVTNDFWYFEVDEEQVDKELFLHLTSTTFFDDLCRIASDGTTNRVRLQADKFFNYEINLPAVAEQRELMAQLKHTNAAVATVLHETDQQLTHLAQLRQALLRDAMQGQLLPQDPSDEPAAVLLKKLQAAKTATGKGGKGKAGTLFAEEPEALKGPFEIPTSWVWARLGDSTKFIDYRGKTPTKTESGVKLITAKNVKRGYFSEHPQEFISEADVKNHMTRGWPIKGDVLFTTEAPLGNACLLNEEPPFALAQRIITLQPTTVLLNTFLLQALLSEGVQAQLQEKASGATAQGIKSSRLVNVLIPLPPLAEQHRIVAKLEQLLQHCDALEQRIRESRRLAEQLLQTALREALAPPAGTSSLAMESALAEALHSAPSRPKKPAKSVSHTGDLFT